MRPNPGSAGLSAIPRVDDVNRIHETVIVSIELAKVHDWVHQGESVLHHFLGVIWIIETRSIVGAGIIGLGLRERYPRQYGALQIHDAIGIFFVSVPPSTRALIYGLEGVLKVVSSGYDIYEV